MKIFEEGGEKPFRKSKGRQKEQGRVVFDPQENDEDKSDTPMSSDSALVTEITTGEVGQDQTLPPADKLEVVENLAETPAPQEVIGEESKPVIEKQKPVVSETKARVEKGERSVIDEQIASMQRKLKKFEISSKQFDRIATPEQKAERAKLIEELKRGIEDAEKKKAELKAAENKRVKKAQAERDETQAKVSERKKALEDQGKITSKEFTEKDAETLLKAVWGKDVFTREDKNPEEIIKEEKPKRKTNKKTESTKNGSKNNKGVVPSSGLTSSEEAQERLRAERRVKRATKKETTAEKPPAEPIVVLQADVTAPVVEIPDEKERQMELPIEIIPNGPNWGTASEEPKQPEREKLFDRIHRLNKEVAEAREQYVKEDYENTKIWKKLTSLFRIKDDEKKGEWRALYEAKTLELQKAELEMVQDGKKDNFFLRDTRKEMSGLLRYYKLDERTNLVNERTQYRAKNLTFGETIKDSLGIVGRWYNSISFKNKMKLSGALIGAAAVAPFIAGGAVGAVSVAAIARRWAAGAGTAVGTEAFLEKWGENRHTKKTEKEIEQQMSGLEGTLTDKAFSNLEKMLEQDVLSLDSKLQHEKRAKTYRKLAATTLGVAVGFGWLAQIIMDKLGGREALEWAKEHFIGSAPISEDLTLPGRTGMPSVSPDAVQIKTNFIHDFINKDITVEKGDSVWKISGRLADNLGLDGAERTHFIDALKDQYGDTPLKAGEHINFSSHGINDDFVKHALDQSHALSPEKLASITANDARISEFAKTHPNFTLTDETTKNILEGKAGVSSSLEDLRLPNSAIIDNEAVATSTEKVVYVPAEGAVPPEFETIDLDKRVDGWYKQIFKVDNVRFGERVLGKDAIEALKLRDILQDAKLFQQGATDGYTTGMNRQEIANFARFFQGASQKEIGFDAAKFLRDNPNITLRNYFENVAPRVKFGTRIGPYYAL